MRCETPVDRTCPQSGQLTLTFTTGRPAARIAQRACQVIWDLRVVVLAGRLRPGRAARRPDRIPALTGQFAGRRPGDA
jgi:hypothetical protein